MRRRRRLGPTLGGVNASWRWEVGAPLVLMGTLIAVAALAVADAGLLFWIGAVLVALGLLAFGAG